MRSDLAQLSVSSICPLHKSHNRNCCSVSRSPGVIPFVLSTPKPQLVKFVAVSLPAFLTIALASDGLLIVNSDFPLSPQFVSSPVLRL